MKIVSSGKYNHHKILFGLVLFILTWTHHDGVCFAGYPGSEKAVVQAVQKVEPSVVFIRTIWSSSTYSRARRGMGSGVILSKSGWIITNAHVTRNARKVFVTLNDGRTVKAEDWRAAPSEDIAVVKISADGLRPAPLGDSDRLRKGQIAIAIGNPWMFTSTVTVGCVSATGRKLKAMVKRQVLELQNLIQTDAAINPGNSGGALVDSSGKVIGINTLVYTGKRGSVAQGMGFAIPINRAVKISKALINRTGSGSVKPWLGVSVQQISPEMGLRVKNGAVIVGFPPNSPARKAGMRVGDIILQIDSTPIRAVEDVRKAIFERKPGEKVKIIFLRGSRKYQATITLEGMKQ